MHYKKREILNFLDDKIFFVLKEDKSIPSSVKSGLRLTRARISALPANSIVQYIWSAITGTDKSVKMYEAMKQCKLTTFEDVIEEFREKFDDKWMGAA